MNFIGGFHIKSNLPGSRSGGIGIVTHHPCSNNDTNYYSPARSCSCCSRENSNDCPVHLSNHNYLDKWKRKTGEKKRKRDKPRNLSIRPAVLHRVAFPSIAAGVIAAGIRAVERFARAGVVVAHFQGLMLKSKRKGRLRILLWDWGWGEKRLGRRSSTVEWSERQWGEITWLIANAGPQAV